ncbi:hypothetical protein V6N12_061222 [Hibiscus sabdariffa]|uniref:Uncharacterized protein n=1 Tax=Hibiscus sabdariffa TaxID=183260 RepID=A0ABR2DWF8_9ROSI
MRVTSPLSFPLPPFQFHVESLTGESSELRSLSPDLLRTNTFLFSRKECIITWEPSLGCQGHRQILSQLHLRILGSSSEYVQSNISRYFSDPQYYFQVNDHYVRNKLNVVLLPFLHRGHWTRISETVGGRLSYKPPIFDINAPDLYIPFMAFGTYVVLAGLSLGLQGKKRQEVMMFYTMTNLWEPYRDHRICSSNFSPHSNLSVVEKVIKQFHYCLWFSPEALNWLFVKGLFGWFLQVMLLKVTLLSLGSGEAPLLDILAYAGYTFTGMCLAVVGRIVWRYSYYFLMPWTCLCMGVFLVKTMKRVLFAEVRSYDSSKNHYLLLFIALIQFPLFTWLGNISVNWLF